MTFTIILIGILAIFIICYLNYEIGYQKQRVENYFVKYTDIYDRFENLEKENVFLNQKIQKQTKIMDEFIEQVMELK